MSTARASKELRRARLQIEALPGLSAPEASGPLAHALALPLHDGLHRTLELLAHQYRQAYERRELPPEVWSELRHKSAILYAAFLRSQADLIARDALQGAFR